MPYIHHIPAYRRHKSTGQAVVTVNGRDFYLGQDNTAASRRKYDRMIAEWQLGGRSLPSIGVSQNNLGTSYRRIRLTWSRTNRNVFTSVWHDGVAVSARRRLRTSAVMGVQKNARCQLGNMLFYFAALQVFVAPWSASNTTGRCHRSHGDHVQHCGLQTWELATQIWLSLYLARYVGGLCILLACPLLVHLPRNFLLIGKLPQAAVFCQVDRGRARHGQG